MLRRDCYVYEGVAGRLAGREDSGLIKKGFLKKGKP
jgi:hypothetical protein